MVVLLVVTPEEWLVIGLHPVGFVLLARLVAMCRTLNAFWLTLEPAPETYVRFF
jgi:hypothetical protein